MPPDLAQGLTLNSSNYPCLELIFMVPMVFEPMKFDCSMWVKQNGNSVMTENPRNTRLNTDIPIADHYDKAGHSLENMLFQIIHILPTYPVDGKSMHAQA